MARIHRMLVGFVSVLVTNQTPAVAAVVTVPVTNLTAADTGDHFTGDFDFGVAFSQVDSLDFDFVMPNGYEGFAPTIDNNLSRSLYVVIHGTDDTIQFTNIGLGFPFASSLFANFGQIDPGVSAGMHYQPITPPFSWPANLQQAFRDFVNSGHGRVMFVDVELRTLDLPLGHVASYAIPGEITQARITVTGTLVPESNTVVLLLLERVWKVMSPTRRPVPLA